MFLRVHVRLLSCPDGARLYEHTWTQTSGARPFKNWAEADAHAFRQELSAASRAVAESIVEEIFLAYRPEQSKAKTHAY
jgi:hypothetical protein